MLQPRIVFLALLCAFNMNVHGQSLITVDAQFGESGCDLFEAVIAADLNIAIGGCAAGQSGGSDNIIFSPDFFTTGGADAGADDDVALVYDLPQGSCGVSNSETGETFFTRINHDVGIFSRSPSEKVELRITSVDPDADCRHFEVVDGGRLLLSNLVLTGGRADNGGAMNVENGSELIIQNSRFKDNASSLRGGALTALNSRVEIRNSEFRANNVMTLTALAGRGGAVNLDDADAQIEDSVFIDNATIGSNGSSGAISISAFDRDDVAVSVTRTAFTGNQAPTNGGAIFLTGGSLTLRDSTLSDNSVSTGASAIQARILSRSSVRLTIFNSTIANNNADFPASAGIRGGAIGIDSITAPTDGMLNVTIRNSIISGNRNRNGAQGHDLFIEPLQDGDTVVVDNTLIGDSSSTLEQSVFSDNSLFLLELLQSGLNNTIASQGFTTSTSFNRIVLPLSMARREDGLIDQPIHRLAPASPAIDRATDVVNAGMFPLLFRFEGCRTVSGLLGGVLGAFREDQLGNDRPIGAACDLGAVEGEGDDDLCFPIVGANGATAVICL